MSANWWWWQSFLRCRERDLVEALWRKPLNEAYEAGAVEEFGAGTPPDAWVGSQLKPHLPILMHLLFQPHELAKSCWSPTIQNPIRSSKNGIYHMSQLESMNWSVSPKIAQLCIYFCFCPLFNVSICVCLCLIVSVLACVSVCLFVSVCVTLWHPSHVRSPARGQMSAHKERQWLRWIYSLNPPESFH